MSLNPTKNEVILFQPTLQSLSTPIWNNIPEHMKSAKTMNTFKSMLKKHLFYTYSIAIFIIIILSLTAFLFYMFIINYVLFLFIHK